MRLIALILITFKIAGLGTFSWWIPFILILVDGIIRGTIYCKKNNSIGSDWHSGMFD